LPTKNYTYNYFIEEDTIDDVDDDVDDDGGRERKYGNDGKNPRGGKVHSTPDALTCRRAVENQPPVTLPEDPEEMKFTSSRATKELSEVALNASKPI